MTKPNSIPTGTASFDLSASDAAARVGVWDPRGLPLVAGGLAIAFIVEDDLLDVHVWAGYLVLALISIRLVWGLSGTRHARFKDFVRGPGEILAYPGTP